jgi:excisionase family DNA binding protein
MQERVYTVQEVAQSLRVSERTVRYWIERGELVAFPIGKRGYRIRQSAIDDFVRNQESKERTGKTDEPEQEAP